MTGWIGPAPPFLRHTRACRGYLAASGTDIRAGYSEIAATERGNDRVDRSIPRSLPSYPRMPRVSRRLQH